MAGVRRSWVWLLAVTALIVSVGAAQSLLAQQAASPESGSITGRLTDLNSMPVASAVVVLRNEANGAEMHTITQKNGVYSFTGLDSGTYSVSAESEQLGRGQLEHIFVTDGHETRVQTAMEFEPATQEPVEAVIRQIAPAARPVNNSTQDVTHAFQADNKNPPAVAPAVKMPLPAQPLPAWNLHHQDKHGGSKGLQRQRNQDGCATKHSD